MPANRTFLVRRASSAIERCGTLVGTSGPQRTVKHVFRAVSCRLHAYSARDLFSPRFARAFSIPGESHYRETSPGVRTGTRERAASPLVEKGPTASRVSGDREDLECHPETSHEYALPIVRPFFHSSRTKNFSSRSSVHGERRN